MSFTEYILSAFRCLSASKMRTFLTTLGIIVGISSVILINTIGNTIGTTIGTTLNAQMQGNIMQVLIVEKDADTSSLSAAMTYMPDGEMKFKRSWIEKYEEVMGDTLGEYLDFSIGNGKLTTSDNASACIAFQAASAPQLRGYNYVLESGRFLSDMDDETGSASVMISNKSAEKMFGKTDPIGQQVVIGGTGSVFDGRELTVVGVYKYDDQIDRLLGNDTDADDFSTTAFVSPTYYYNAINRDSDSSDQIYLLYLLESDADVEQITKDTEEFFEPYFEGTDYRIWVYTLTEQVDQINEIIDVITKIISAIAAISLLVGGIGVMNIMLVSVTERTMEIGVRKAMGADNNSIRIQFLVESVIISLIGSVLGIVIGLVLAKAIALIISAAASDIVVDLSAPVSAIILSVAFSFAVGLVFGVYPADKAAKMEVVDALRYE